MQINKNAIDLKVHDNPSLLDTSDLCRTEFFLKEKEAFRNYSKEDEIGQRVKRTYTEMHTNQTVDFVRQKHDKWLKFNHFQATIMEALEMLNDLVDESDPDTELPNTTSARSWLSTASRSGVSWVTQPPKHVSISRYIFPVSRRHLPCWLQAGPVRGVCGGQFPG